MASKVVIFAEKAIADATDYAKLANSSADIASIWADRGYAGGANSIVDADISGLNITTAQLTSYITYTQQIANFIGNITVLKGDYDATLNAIRSDI